MRTMAAVFAALAGLSALAGAAQARTPPAYPAYPQGRSQPVIEAWLRAETDIDPKSLVAIADTSLFSIEPAPGAVAAPLRRVAIRQEALDADFAHQMGARSLVLVVDVDCAKRQTFQRALTLYRGNNKQGTPMSAGAGQGWEPVTPGSAIANALDAACAGPAPSGRVVE